MELTARGRATSLLWVGLAACAVALAARPAGASAGVVVPSLTVSNAKSIEGDSGSVLARFKVRLSSASPGGISVDYATANGSAHSPADYGAAAGTLQFGPGKTQRMVTVAVHGDRADERDERFMVTLSNPIGATIADGTGNGKILDDDGVLNETDMAEEADFCNIQFPASMTASTGTSTGTVFGQILEAGVTEGAGPSSQVTAQLGLGPGSTDPRSNAGWTFQAAPYNTQVGDNDEYAQSFIAPAPGSYAYAYRFSLDGGFDWTYCDLNGAGSGSGLTFETGQLGVLTVTP